MILNGEAAAELKLEGSLASQPLEPLEVGRDSDGVVGNYQQPFPLDGTVDSLVIDIL